MVVAVRGDKALARKFRAMAQEAQMALADQAASAGAVVIREAIKENAPVRTGNLRDSIEIEQGE